MSATNCRSSTPIPGFPRPSPSAASSTTSPAAISAKSRAPHRRSMLTAGDEHGFDVEGESGNLEVIFEEPEEAKFVISPNTPVREIWVSALSTSFKLGWNEPRNAFVHEKTGEDLRAVMSRVISQQLGAQVTL